MATSERRIENVWDAVTGGTTLMLLILIADVYAAELFQVYEPVIPWEFVGLFEFKLLLFVSAAAAVLLVIRLRRSSRSP